MNLEPTEKKMKKQIVSYGDMDANEVQFRHRVLAAAGAVSIFIGGWLIVVENLTLLGCAVGAPGALIFGMSQRLARISGRHQYAALAIAAITLFGGSQYREVHRWDWAVSSNLPKCHTDRIPLKGCYTVSIVNGSK